MEARKGKAITMTELKEDLMEMANNKPKLEDKAIKMKKKVVSYVSEVKGTFWEMCIEQGYSPYGDLLAELNTLASKWEKFMTEFAKVEGVVKSSSKKVSLNQLIPEILAECAKKIIISFEFVKKALIELLPRINNLENTVKLLGPTYKKAKNIVEDNIVSNNTNFVDFLSSLAAFATIFQGVKGGQLKWPGAEAFISQLYKKLQQDLTQAMLTQKMGEGVPLYHFELFCDFYELVEHVTTNVNLMINNINHNMDYITKALFRIVESAKKSAVLQDGPEDWKRFVNGWKELAEGVEYYINTANEAHEECYYV